MRYLGLDLGTKTLGVSITDKSGILVSPLKTIHFPFEDYNNALNQVLEITKEKEIDLVVLGLPKNMDGSIGFAGNRSLNFKKLLENNNIKVILFDERLTTKIAEDIVHDNLDNVKNTKGKIDAIAASIILEDYLESVKNDIKE
jgi:putative Holliday junction resolvase